MTPDMTKKTPVPKRVLNSVQRNVAVLVELLKAEGIAPEVDYEVKYRPVISFTIATGKGTFERAFFCLFVYHDVIYSYARIGGKIKKSMRRTMCEYVVRANADEFDPGEFLLDMKDGTLNVYSYCDHRLLREDPATALRVLFRNQCADVAIHGRWIDAVVKGEVEPGKAIVNAHRGVMRYYKKDEF